LSKVRRVKKIQLAGDKVQKATEHCVLPFESGEVYFSSKIPKVILNEFMKVLNGFPSHPHDDDVDALGIMIAMGKSNGIDYRDVA